MVQTKINQRQRDFSEGIVFAKVGDRGFIAGVSLDEVARHTKLIYPELPLE